MKILKRKQCLLFILFLSIFIPVSNVSALEITEIMYDIKGTDSGREWIEIYNNSDSSKKITEHKLIENDVSHKINSNNELQTILEVGEYAVIADNVESFLLDNPNYSSYLFESSFSLSNGGEVLKISDSSSNIIDTKTYSGDMGAKGNGLSLQYVSSEELFIEAEPTPGETNASEPFVIEEQSGDISDSDSSSDDSTHSEQVNLSLKIPTKTISVSAGRNRKTFPGIPIEFDSLYSESERNGKIKYFWNFGDGNTTKGRRVKHTYKFPGLYNVVLNAVGKTNKAVSRTEVLVLESKIEAVVNEYGIEIKNNSNSEINIGNFKIKKKKKDYLFPKDTIVSSNSSIIFSWNILGISDYSSLENKYIFYPNNTRHKITIE